MAKSTEALPTLLPLIQSGDRSQSPLREHLKHGGVIALLEPGDKALGQAVD